MLHLFHFPSIYTRAATLQAQYLYRSTRLPRDTLLAHLLPYIRSSNNNSHWYRLSASPMWKQFCVPRSDPMDPKTFNLIRKQFIEQQYRKRFEQSDSLFLSSCRPDLHTDPILWLPMTRSERSRVIRWRLGWLPGGKPKECCFHPQTNWSRHHAIACLDMHHRLLQPQTIDDPLSFLLNLLPSSKPTREIARRSWYTYWPRICTILHELDHLFHDEQLPSPIEPANCC